MVSEKICDIGVFCSLGASMPGVAWFWLRYGMFIGIVGSVVGVAGAYVIVININPIHEWIGETFNLVIWDPSVYYFVEIPREVQLVQAVIVFVSGILTCVLGAAVPAIRAARMDSVKALRFE